MIKKIVIANRGEIARRIMRAARLRGYEVAVISTSTDSDALVRLEADAVLEVSSFLNVTEIVAASKKWGAQYLHPGYGFLSENADFASAVNAAGIFFVGPTPENMTAMGGKESAKSFAKKAQVPTLDALYSHELAALAPEKWANALHQRGIVSPYLVKASGGGGGRGMRIVDDVTLLPEAITRASEEAMASFNDGTVFIESYLLSPRHIEIQVFGDGKGGGVFWGERECSLQRRHQKVIEEAPSSVVSPQLRETMGRASLELVKRTCYLGAGTVEFLLDSQGRFYFLEMNTRLQVEHPVTEWVYGIDLVQAQLELAETGKMPMSFGDGNVFMCPTPRGVAIEARILAEDPRNQFMPTPGPLLCYLEPQGTHIRVDSGVCQGGKVNAQFDSMISKLIVWGETRAEAYGRLAYALERYVILGCITNIPFLLACARHSDVVNGYQSTAWIAQNLDLLNASVLPESWVEFLKSQGFRDALVRVMYGESNSNVNSVGTRNVTFQIVSLKNTDIDCFELKGPLVASLLNVGFEKISTAKRSQGLANAIVNSQKQSVIFYAKRISGSQIALFFWGESLLLEDPIATLNAALDTQTHGSGEVFAPMAGRVLEVKVKESDAVHVGQVLIVVESMKMQLEVKASRNGVVSRILIVPGQILSGPDLVLILE